MKESHYLHVINQSPFGYAYNIVVRDKQGKVIGYKILETNENFLQITGINPPDFHDRVYKELIPNIIDQGSDDLGLYSRISAEACSLSLNRFSVKEGRMFNIKFISEERDHFSIVVSSSDNEGPVNNHLLNLSRQLIGSSETGLDFNSLTEEICNLSGAQYGVFNLYSIETMSFMNKGIYGQTSFINKAYKLLGFPLNDKEWNISKARLNEIEKDDLIKFNSIAEMSKEELPEIICNAISELINIGIVYVVAIRIQEKLLGDFILLFKKGKDIQNRSAVAAFANMVGIAINRNNLNTELQKSEHNLKNFFNCGIDCHWVLDSEGTILAINETVTNWLGYKETELIGKNVLAVHPPELKDEAEENVRLFLSGKNLTCHLPILTKTGQRIPVETYLMWGDWNGKKSIFGISKDISALKLSEDKFQYQAELRKLLVELSSSFINLPLAELEKAILNSLKLIGTFVGADRAYIFEYDFDNMVAINKIEWSRIENEFRINQPQTIPFQPFAEWLSLHKKGESVLVRSSEDVEDAVIKSILIKEHVKSLLTIPLFTHESCTGFVGFDSIYDYHDFTDFEHQLLQVYAQTLVNVRERIEKEEKLVEAKEKAEESDRLKSAFLANMSHEIRTPMNGIMGFLDLLREPDLNRENRETYIEIVNRSGKRLLETLNDIIEISKIEALEMNVNLSEVNTEELMTYFLSFFTPQAEDKGIALIPGRYLKGKESVIITDKGKIEGIIANLLKNAIKFTHEGFIEFSNYIENDNIVFCVKDTGTGIPKERHNIIFERFVQVDLSPNRIHEGSGLGLSIVKAYVGMLGGEIWLTSEKDKGSTFYFSLPLRKISGNNPGSITLKPTSMLTSKKEMTVVIVEDDRASFIYLEKILSADKYKLIRFSNGNDAVKFVRENTNIDLILMDIKIPGISGIEATKQIREFNKDVPIIAQTAYAFAIDKENILAAGCNEYISKPINSNELLKLVNRYSPSR